MFSPSSCHTILVFHTKRGGDIPTGTALTGTSNAGGVGKNAILDEYLAVLDNFVYWRLQHIYRITLIGVFLSHFRINLHQTRTQYCNHALW